MAPSVLMLATLCLSLLALPTAYAAESPYGITFDQLNAQLHELGFKSIPKHTIESANDQTFNQTQQCSYACNSLQYMTGEADMPKSKSYRQDRTNFWAIQQRVSPACFFLPTSPEAVAAAVLVAQFTQCPFAVKSGGHAAFKGASNIPNGVTIDLQRMNEVTVSANRKTTQVGPGNRWIDVYNALTPKNLTVIGGRVSAIGVGGLTLGGGVSFFSGRHGWACDNVNNYQVVLANGTIANVNYTSAPDLYYALRGGGNNFGVVTRFDLATYPQGLMFGGMLGWPISSSKSLISAFSNFLDNSASDPDAALIVAFAYAQGQFFASADLEHATPVMNPPIFKDFLAIPNRLSDTLRITTLPNITNEFETVNPSGLREIYITSTFLPSKELYTAILNMFMEEVKQVGELPGFLPAAVYQAISHDEIKYFSKNGGNALGLADTKGPLMLLNLAIMWSNESDDEKINTMVQNIIRRATAYAKAKGVYNPYLYQNYAYKGQKVIESYGAANVAKLVAASKKYDPHGVFQKLQPGYFKLPM